VRLRNRCQSGRLGRGAEARVEAGEQGAADPKRGAKMNGVGAAMAVGLDQLFGGGEHSLIQPDDMQ